ncbi:ParB/Srx family N-terminal domain-containing protein [Aliikangiella sp. IMCC44632]
MSIKTQEITVSLAQLMLDPSNYRLNKGEESKNFVGDDIVAMQDEVQSKMISENIADLESSILKNGFLEVDKIVVKELKDISNFSELKRYVVIEGNRRTAAFKSLIQEFYLSDKERFSDDFPGTLVQKYNNINVILVTGSEEEIKDYSQRLMGIRHVSGPRQWGGYQSAKLIHDMSAQGYKQISTLLGMRPSEAQRRHEAYLAIEQMKKDPLYSDRATPKLFTLFAEIVASNKKFKEEWLGWNPDKKVFEHKKNLHRVYDAILPGQDGEKEIGNPSKLRFFAKCINREPIRTQLEDGVLLENINYDFDAEARIKKIKEFLRFTEKLSSLSVDESVLYSKLEKKIIALLNKMGE